MEIINWGLAMFGVDNLPSLDVMKDIDDALQDMCGIDTIRHKGPLGHVYYLNDLAAIIAQVRLILVFLADSSFFIYAFTGNV